MYSITFHNFFYFAALDVGQYVESRCYILVSVKELQAFNIPLEFPSVIFRTVNLGLLSEKIALFKQYKYNTMSIYEVIERRFSIKIEIKID